MDRRTFLSRHGGCRRTRDDRTTARAWRARRAGPVVTARHRVWSARTERPGLALPREFNYQVISRQGQPMHDGFPTPGAFDGMGAFPGQHGATILIRNHENRERLGEVPVVSTAPYDSTVRGGNTKLVVRREKAGLNADGQQSVRLHRREQLHDSRRDVHELCWRSPAVPEVDHVRGSRQGSDVRPRARRTIGAQARLHFRD